MTTQPRIGPYRVVETIGHGGFATVFRCVDDRLEAEVAIKVLADNHAADPNIRSRFLAEGRILRKIDNRHLIQVHDVGETDRNQPYLVLELADRGDLRSRAAKLHESGWLPTWDDVQHLADALLDAASALHQSDLVHRDLSPSNVLIKTTSRRPSTANTTLLQADERLIVADLGFAKDLALGSGQTVGGGTPHFSAPEQFNRGQVTHKSDLYAVGKVLEWFVHSVDANDPKRMQLLSALAPILSTNPADRPETATEMNEIITVSIQNDLQQALAPTVIDCPPAPPSGVPPTSVPPIPLPATDSVSNEGHISHQDTPLGATHSPPQQMVRGSGIRRKLPWFFAAVSLFLVVAIAGIGVLTSGVLDPPEVTAIGSNLGRVTDKANQPQVVVDGPIDIPAGRTGVFVATTPLSSTLVWTLPGGAIIEDTNAIEVTGNGIGSGVLRLDVQTPDDETIRIEFPFDVVQG